MESGCARLVTKTYKFNLPNKIKEETQIDHKSITLRLVVMNSNKFGCCGVMVSACMSDLMQASSFNTDLVITSNNLRKFLEPICRKKNGPRTIPCCKNQS